MTFETNGTLYMSVPKPPTERDALLAAVLAAPADDLPRLVFADWLEESGEQVRADFIRRQIRMIGPGEDSLWCCDVLDKYGKEWCPIPHVFRMGGMAMTLSTDLWMPFRRGFVDFLRGSLSVVQQHGPTILSLHPVTAVELTDANLRDEPVERKWLESQLLLEIREQADRLRRTKFREVGPVTSWKAARDRLLAETPRRDH